MDKVIKKLERGEALTTRDFTALGYGMEDFLRYSQVSGSRRRKFHILLLDGLYHKQLFNS